MRRKTVRYTEKIKKYLPPEKAQKYLTWIFLACAVVLIFLSFGGHTEARTEKMSKEEVIERRIEELCKSIDGIKEAHVMVTLETVPEGEDNTLSLYNSTPSSERVKVIGVGVVCTNGDRGDVRREVTELISAVLSLPIRSIKVMKIGN